MKNSSDALYQFLCATFCVIVVMSNIISAKMVSLPFFDNFVIPAGLMTYPFAFLLSDLVTEIYGAQKAKAMVYIAFAMNLVSFGMIQTVVLLPTGDPVSHAEFRAVLGLSGLRIFASLAAFISAQIVDIQLYAMIKRWTGERFLWLRNNGSTCASQVVDTVLVDMIYLYWGLGFGLDVVAPIMAFSYAYKACFSLSTTPLFYLLVHMIRMRQMKQWNSEYRIQN